MPEVVLMKIPGHDVGFQKDFWGNQSVYVTKSPALVIQPTLDDLLRETGLLKRLREE